jgi:hypothetical protein
LVLQRGEPVIGCSDRGVSLGSFESSGKPERLKNGNPAIRDDGVAPKRTLAQDDGEELQTDRALAACQAKRIPDRCDARVEQNW